MKAKLQKLIESKYFPPIAAFLLLVLVKLILVLPMSTGPISFGDEALYKKFSLQWITEGRQLDTHYPPVYPLLMTFSFLGRSHWYLAMKLLNIVYSSFVPVLTYLIARLYLTKRNSIYCMIISCVLPYHFILPTMILSENVFFPILLLEIYIVLREYPRHPLLGDFITGFFLTVLYLTRYISLVTIPVFALVWFVKQLNHKTKFVQILLRGIGIVAVMLLSWLPWYLLNYKDTSLKEMMGFGIASNSDPAQLTPERLLLSAVLYTGYFLLLAAPVLPSLFQSFAALDYKKLTSRYNQFWLLIFGLAGAFFVAVTRHSWRASYNYPDFARIMGRYLIFFPLLFILLTFVTWEKKKTPALRLPTIVLSLVSLLLLVTAYIFDIQGILYPGTSEQFLNFKGSMEGYKYVLLGIPFLLIVLCIMLLTTTLKHTRYGYLILFLGMFLFEIYGMNQYCDRMQRFRDSKDTETITAMNMLLAANLPPVTAAIADDQPITPLYFDLPEDVVNTSWETRVLKFFCNYNYVHITTKFDEMAEGTTYYVVTATPEDYDTSQVLKTLGSFERDGVLNTLMLVTKHE